MPNKFKLLAGLMGLMFASLGSQATQLTYFQTFTNTDHLSVAVGGTRETGFAEFSLSGITGTVSKAYLYWHGHGESWEYQSGNTVGSVYFNNELVQGQRIGISGQNGWSFAPYNYYFGAAFRADVTSLVNGNGSFFISDFDPLPFGVQGASLVVIYDDGNPDNNRDVMIYDGCDQNSANTFDTLGWNIFIPNVNFTTGDPATIEFHVSDGQKQYNETAILVNQMELAPSGDFFTGSAPYDPTSGFRSAFFTGSLFDVKSFNLASVLVPGVNNLGITTSYDDDDLTVIATLVSLKTGSGQTPPTPNPFPPSLSCPPAVSVTSSAAVTNITTITVEDRDGDPLTVVWRVNGQEVQQNKVPAGTPITQATLSLNREYGPGSYSISIFVTDSKGGFQGCSTLLTVTAPPDPSINLSPIALPDNASTFSGVPVTINSLQNDSDPEGKPIHITTFTQPSQGTVAQDSNGNFVYTPPSAFIGNVTWTYTISDGVKTASTIVTVIVIGLPPNQPPIAVDDMEATLSGIPVAIDWQANDSDPDGDTISLTGFTQPANGTVVVGSNGQFVYTSSTNFTGTVSFQYTISDGKGSATATVTISVTAPAPIPGPEPCAPCDGKVSELTLRYLGSSQAYMTVIQHDSQVVYTGYVSSNQIITVKGKDQQMTLGPKMHIYLNGSYHTEIHTSCSVPIGPGQVWGKFEIVKGYSRNGGLLCPIGQNPSPTPTPTPEPADCKPCDGKVSQLTLKYKGSGDPIVSVVEFDGQIVYHSRVISGQTFTFKGKDKQNTLGPKVHVYLNGVYHTEIHTSCSVPIGPGQVWGNFEIIEGYSRNGGLLCPITSTPPLNKAPEAVNDSTTTTLGKSVTITVLGNDSDPDGNTISVTSYTQPSKGSVQLVDGKIVYTPSSTSTGTVTFQYTISDGKASATATVTVTVQGTASGNDCSKSSSSCTDRYCKKHSSHDDDDDRDSCNKSSSSCSDRYCKKHNSRDNDDDRDSCNKSSSSCNDRYCKKHNKSNEDDDCKDDKSSGNKYSGRY